MDQLPETAYDYRPDHGESAVFCKCSWCGEDILEGEDYFHINHERVCEACVEDTRCLAER